MNPRQRSVLNPLPLVLGLLVAGAGLPVPIAWAQQASFTRKEDVIYGRKYGVALTLDVFTPKEKPNGAALIHVISGGWLSSHEAIAPGVAQEFLARGYTVFAVVHGSQPKFTIPEIVEDMHRATRFVRHNAKEYGIDPERIGIFGASAGGHLSLMQGTAGDAGKPEAKDPIDRASSRVHAVACFFPPTDFLNYGTAGENALGRGILANFRAAFDFREYDKQAFAFLPVTDETKVLEIGRKISPVTHASSDDPPTLIIHGDADKLVPIQQAEVFLEKLKAAGVETKLVVKPGAAHGWKDLSKDFATLADWFDSHLAHPQGSGNRANELASLLGVWKVTTQVGDDQRDSELKLTMQEGKLRALYISPRSGEHACRTAVWKDGELLVEMDRTIQDTAVTFVYKGRLSDGKLSGTAGIAGREDEYSGTWRGER